MKPVLKILFLVATIALVGSLPLCHFFKYPTIAKQDVEPSPQPINLVLKAPDTCEIGELVRLDVRDSQVEGIRWQVLPETPDFEVIEDGRRAFFSSRVPGPYLFMIAGAKGGQAYLIYHTVTVDGVVPGPGPNPVVIALDKKVVAWAKKVADYDGKKAHLAGMAGVFTKMADNKDVKVEQILEATALANTAILGAKLDAWVPFLDALGTELDSLVSSGGLTTPEQYRTVWLDIAKGLEQAAQATAK